MHDYRSKSVHTGAPRVARRQGRCGEMSSGRRDRARRWRRLGRAHPRLLGACAKAAYRSRALSARSHSTTRFGSG
eukprot:2684599-Pleurochrysis_carterae.AAC.1